jgi:cholesterol transport system auxiliary component
LRKTALIVLVATTFCGCISSPNWTRRQFAFAIPADPLTTNAPSTVVALNRVSISPLFQNRSFTYRTGENSYEQDPYAGFLIPPERAMAESIRAWIRASGAFGIVAEPGSGLVPTLIAEISVTELYGDFREVSQALGRMQIHFVCYEVSDGNPGRIVLDRIAARETPLAGKTPAALMAAWDSDLRQMMEEFTSEFVKKNLK